MFVRRSSRVKRVAVMLAVAAMMFASAPPLWAWNDAGHMLVARIAWLRLSPEQRVKVCDLLKKHPHYKSYLTDKCPDDVAPDEWAFLRAATWSDYIRPPKGFDPDKIATHRRYKFHRGPWHYVNFPYRAGQQESKLPLQPLPNDTNIVEQIELSVDILRGMTTLDLGAVPNIKPDANRAVRLTWVFHLVGDLHQPLHAIALVDEKLFPDGVHGDQGGNLLAIRPDSNSNSNSKSQRLHSYWDGILGYDSHFGPVCDLAELLLRDPTLSPSKLEELAHDKHARDWAAESYAAAKTYTYLDGNLPRVLWSDVENHAVSPDKIPVLSEADASNARQVARRRVALAGYRLAETLKHALDK